MTDWTGTIAGSRARGALSAVVAIVVTLTIAVQVDFHRQAWRSIRMTGAAVWTPGRLELMAIRYKAELAQRLVPHFAADPVDLGRRVHGSRARDWMEDQGYFVERIRSTSPVPATPTASPSLHYAVLHDAAGGGRRPTGGASRERGYRLPRHRSWRSSFVACRGAMSGSGLRGRRLQIVVSLRSATPGDPAVEAFHLNGAPIAAHRTAVHSTFAAHNTDAIFDVGEHVRDGTNELVVPISGRTPRFDLDVYEIDG